MNIGGPPPRRPLSDGLTKPKNIKEVPSYLFKRAKGFLTRLFYIIGLVWETAPAILIFMALFALLGGLLPVIGAYISKDLLNEIAKLIGAKTEGKEVFEVLSPILFLLLLQFVHHFLKRIVDRLNASVSSIAGELVVNHIKLKIINKSINNANISRIQNIPARDVYLLT